MARLSALVLFAGSALSAAQETTPVSKVLELLNGLKADVESEGRTEADAYDKFACWCKDSTMTKSQAITSGRDRIDSLSAEIQEKTALKEEKQAELKKRQADQERMAAELEDTKTRFSKAEATYTAEEADLSKAIRNLESAIKAIGDSRPTSLLAVRSYVESSLKLASAMAIISEKKRRAVSAFLQTGTSVDPSDPNYAFHSEGILETLDQLLDEFRAEKTTLDTEWGKAKTTFESTIQSLTDSMTENSNAMDTLTGDISDLKGEIATARADLVSSESLLKDDQLYMKDMTERCELRAKDWDQRSKLRADELEALTGALEILSGKVKTLDGEANKRALLIQSKAAPAAQQQQEPVAALAQVSPHEAAVAFLQTAADVSESSRLRGTLSAQARARDVIAMLRKEGQKLRSTSLSALALHMSEGPFDKVKGLIQDLVQRLLEEATAEATKKGFCDQELGKAKKDRDFRHNEAGKLDIEIKGLNLKREELEAELSLLSDNLDTLRNDLKAATDARELERESNLETIKKAKEGHAATKQAISILKAFYSKASRAKVLLEYSPIDEESNSEAGFSGAYKGQQTRSEGIVGMLEVIASDFDRTARQTEEAEKEAHEEFVTFDRDSRGDISGKEKKTELDQEDLKTTVDAIAVKMDDLKTAQDLLDSALGKVEDLKPVCIDTGMSYEERVEKREDEIAALKKALCMLDPNGVETMCA